MRIAGSSLMCSRRGLSEACERVAALGFDAIDIGAMPGWAHVEPLDVLECPDHTAQRVADACDRAGLTPVALNANTDVEALPEEIERVEALIHLAEHLGADVLTLQGGSTDVMLEDDLARFRSLTRAVETDVAVTVETHWGTHLENPDIARRYGEIDGLGLTLDPSHYLIGDYRPAEYRQLLPFVEHVHLRQAGSGWKQVQQPPETGRLDVPGTIAALAKAGYDGVLSIEYIDSITDTDPATVESQAEDMRERVVEAIATLE